LQKTTLLKRQHFLMIELLLIFLLAFSEARNMAARNVPKTPIEELSAPSWLCIPLN